MKFYKELANYTPKGNTVVTIGQINGGYNFNIISDEVILKGTTRAYTEENRQLIKNRMKTIIKGISNTYGATIKLKYKGLSSNILNSICWRTNSVDESSN